MNLGARTAMWSGGAKRPTARDYVQDGLIAMWDGIENAGWGVHDPNATVWKDLVGDLDMSYTQHGQIEDTKLVCDGLGFGAYRENYEYFVCDEYTVEMDFSIDNPITTEGMFLKFGIVNGENRTVMTGLAVGRYVNRMLAIYGANRNGQSSLLDDGLAYSVSVVHDGSYALTNGIGDNKRGFMGWAIEKVIAVGAFSNKGTGGLPSSYHNIRVYNRKLTHEERMSNYAISKARFDIQERQF